MFCYRNNFDIVESLARPKAEASSKRPQVWCQALSTTGVNYGPTWKRVGVFSTEMCGLFVDRCYMRAVQKWLELQAEGQNPLLFHPERLLDAADLRALTPLDTQIKIKHAMACNGLPLPRRIGRRRVWSLGEILNWFDSLPRDVVADVAGDSNE